MARYERMRRGGLAISASLLTVSAAVMGFAGPAGAATVPNQNHLIFQGGSETTYDMMTQLAEDFNQSPGCDIVAIAGQTQNLDYRCANPQNPDPGLNGLGDGLGYTNTGSVAQGDPENPYNDVVVEYPAYGSSNGIKELTQRGTNDVAIDLARSSRGPNNGQPVPVGDQLGTPSSSDPQGLNFVAFAADAVPWMHWTKVNGKKTPSAKIQSLSLQQLQAIYNAPAGTSNWSTYGGTAGTIDVYMAQNGSGTEGTWATSLGLTVNGNSPTLGLPGVKDAAHVITENEIGSILKIGDEANALFYFSAGKFSTDCVASKGTCGGDVTGGKSAMVLGSESVTTGGQSIPPTSANILNGTFPTDRYLYNVYANGTNGSFPASSEAALNFASEWGFICKQDSAKDSRTGATYASEIQNIITANGNYPLPTAVIDTPNGSATVDQNAKITDPGYAFVDPQSQAASPSTQQGHCRVLTTDGDGTA